VNSKLIQDKNKDLQLKSGGVLIHCQTLRTADTKWEKHDIDYGESPFELGDEIVDLRLSIALQSEQNELN